jgi:hypothetical protein
MRQEKMQKKGPFLHYEGDTYVEGMYERLRRYQKLIISNRKRS